VARLKLTEEPAEVEFGHGRMAHCAEGQSPNVAQSRSAEVIRCSYRFFSQSWLTRANGEGTDAEPVLDYLLGPRLADQRIDEFCRGRSRISGAAWPAHRGRNAEPAASGLVWNSGCMRLARATGTVPSEPLGGRSSRRSAPPPRRRRGPGRASPSGGLQTCREALPGEAAAVRRASLGRWRGETREPAWQIPEPRFGTGLLRRADQRARYD
jgi:hypothetical protein